MTATSLLPQAAEAAGISFEAVIERLRKLIPRQMFEVAIQAAIGSKIIARETDCIEIVNPNLTLEGLEMIWNRVRAAR